MPDTIAKVAALVAAGVTNATAVLGPTTSAFLGATAGYLTEAALTLGLSAGLTALAAQAVPSPEAGKISRRQPTPPRSVAYGRVRLSGPSLFWEAKGNWTTNVIALAGRKVAGFHRYWLNDEVVDLYETGYVVPPGNGRYPEGFVHLSTRQGEFVETAHEKVMEKFPQWTSSHRGDGIATLAMVAGRGRKEQFQERYPNGEPEPSVETDGALVYDPRDPDQDPGDMSTWAWTRNAALILLDFEAYEQRTCWRDAFDEDGRLIQEFLPARWARLFAPTIELWKTAADICDEEVALAAGGTVKRYEAGGQTDTSVQADATRQTILSCFDGWIGRTGQGARAVYAGKLYTPTVTITDAEIVELITEQGVADEESCNVLAITYTDPALDYTTAEAGRWYDHANIEKRRGKERSKPLSLNWVQVRSQARRLAKRAMKRQNAAMTGVVKVHMTANTLDALGQRYIRLQTEDSALLADTVVEVTGGGLSIAEQTVTFAFATVDADLDDWDPAEEEGEDAGTGRPDPAGVGVPDGLEGEAVIEPVSSTGDGARLQLRFDDPDDGEHLTYVVRWRVDGADSYQYEYIDAAADLGAQLELLTGFVTTNATLNVSVAFIGAGQGEFAADIDIDTTLPSPAVTSDSILVTADSAAITCDEG